MKEKISFWISSHILCLYSHLYYRIIWYSNWKLLFVISSWNAYGKGMVTFLFMPCSKKVHYFVRKTSIIGILFRLIVTTRFLSTTLSTILCGVWVSHCVLSTLDVSWKKMFLKKIAQMICAKVGEKDFLKATSYINCTNDSIPARPARPYWLQVVAPKAF